MKTWPQNRNDWLRICLVALEAFVGGFSLIFLFNGPILVRYGSPWALQAYPLTWLLLLISSICLWPRFPLLCSIGVGIVCLVGAGRLFDWA